MQITIKAADLNPGQDSVDMDALAAAGWRYIDPATRFSHEMWDVFCEMIGADNYRILAMTIGTTRDGFAYKRGQFMVSPDGMQRLHERAAEAAANKTGL